MNHNSTNYNLEDAERMIQDFEEGIISPENHAILMRMFSENLEVRRLYFDHMETVALLKQTVKNREELHTLPISEDMLRHQKRRTAFISFTLGIAALILIGFGFLLYNVNQISAPTNQAIAMELSSGASCSITYVDNEQRDNSNLRPGDSITLSSGLTRFTFPSGVEAIIEGPTELKLTSQKSVEMKGGLAWFKVPESGHGFTVQTDRAKIIDLGTEFGLWFDGEKNLQIHVAKGKILVEPILKTLPKQNLTENNAILLDLFGRSNSIQCQNSLFRRHFTNEIPYLHWSFDNLVDGKFKADGSIPNAEDFAATPSHLNPNHQSINPQVYLTKGRFNSALSMDGKGRFADTSFPGINGNFPRTFTAWIKHRESFSNSDVKTPYCAWGTRELFDGGAWKIYLGESNSHTFGTSVIGLEKNAPMPQSSHVQKWVHIASVYTGQNDDDGYPEIHHYINGILIESSNTGFPIPVRTQTVSTSTPNAKPVRFGASILAQPGDTTVDGDLDEVYLFRSALSVEQIKQLMEENRLDFFHN